MHWIDAHQPLVETIAVAVLVLVTIAMLVALRRVLRQGRRAMFGAHPVIGPPEFAAASDGGLVLVVPFSNAAVEPASRFSARVSADGVRAAAPPGSVTLFGRDAGLDADKVRIAFDWPVGMMNAEVRVTWSWSDPSGSHEGSWRGHLRVPQPDLPPDREPSSPAVDTGVEASSGPGEPDPGDPGADAGAVAGNPRVDPLSHIRAGTAKASERSEARQ